MNSEVAPPAVKGGKAGAAFRPQVTGWGPRSDDEALFGAVDHLLALQHADGCWEGEMVWNTMILSQYVILLKITGRLDTVSERERAAMIRHFEVTAIGNNASSGFEGGAEVRSPQSAGAGAWGMHAESGGYVFFTALAYIALRMLGLAADHPLCADARRFLQARPNGILSIPSWGKYWLAFLDLYDYQGVNPSPPELFLLPRWLPVHPNRYYCHTRQIYLALSYLYGRRFRADLGELRDALRGELYTIPYESVEFTPARHVVAVTDLYVKPGPGLKKTFDAMHAHEARHSPWLRQKALEHCIGEIVFEQRASRYQGLSPVNGILDSLALWAEGVVNGSEHPELAPSIAGIAAWKWEDEAEGIRYCGARSNTWDTAFAMQALLASEVTAERAAARLHDGYRYLVGAQMTEELEGGAAHGRDAIRGGWCFSDGEHRWPVSDCTAEAVCALMDMHERLPPPEAERISDERLRWAAEFILLRQNDDGGFGTYERRRGGPMLESVNATEMYGACMTERSYIECTASSVAALSMLRREGVLASGRLLAQAEQSIDRGVAFLRRSQREDGAFPGFWGINFTYGIFHVVKGLRAAGVRADDPLCFGAAVWLIDKQRSDGGWGEHYSSCQTGEYVEHRESQAVMTSWAVLALLEILGPEAGAVERGLAFLRARRSSGGSDGKKAAGWPSEAVNGVFFGSAMLDYRLYKDVFPTWALARHRSLVHRVHSSSTTTSLLNPAAIKIL